MGAAKEGRERETNKTPTESVGRERERVILIMMRAWRGVVWLYYCVGRRGFCGTGTHVRGMGGGFNRGRTQSKKIPRLFRGVVV